MDKTPPPLSLSAALALPLPEGRRSSEILVDGDLELRLYAPKGHDPQTPHDRDEFYVVATGTGRYRIEATEVAIAPGDMLFAAAHAEHGFVARGDDFSEWIVFYGPVK